MMNLIIFLLDVFSCMLILTCGYFVPYITIVGVGCVLVIGICMLLFCLIVSIYVGLKYHTCFPLALIMLSLFFLVVARKTYFVERLDFKINRNVREEIVEIVRNEDVIYSENGTLKLPELYCNNLISQSNQISVYQEDNEIILYFYYFQGMLEESTGFLYAKGDIDFDEIDMKEIINFGDGWYFCKTY